MRIPYIIIIHLFSKLYERMESIRQTVKRSPTISVFKGELVRLVRPSKKSYFCIHDIERVRLRARLQVQFIATQASYGKGPDSRLLPLENSNFPISVFLFPFRMIFSIEFENDQYDRIYQFLT